MGEVMEEGELDHAPSPRWEQLERIGDEQPLAVTIDISRHGNLGMGVEGGHRGTGRGAGGVDHLEPGDADEPARERASGRVEALVASPGGNEDLLVTSAARSAPTPLEQNE